MQTSGMLAERLNMKQPKQVEIIGWKNRYEAMSKFLEGRPAPGSVVKIGTLVYAVVAIDGTIKVPRWKCGRKLRLIARLHDGQPTPSLDVLYNEFCRTGRALTPDEAAGVLLSSAIASLSEHG